MVQSHLLDVLKWHNRCRSAVCLQTAGTQARFPTRSFVWWIQFRSEQSKEQWRMVFEEFPIIRLRSNSRKLDWVPEIISAFRHSLIVRRSSSAETQIKCSRRRVLFRSVTIGRIERISERPGELLEGSVSDVHSLIRSLENEWEWLRVPVPEYCLDSNSVVRLAARTIAEWRESTPSKTQFFIWPACMCTWLRAWRAPSLLPIIMPLIKTYLSWARDAATVEWQWVLTSYLLTFLTNESSWKRTTTAQTVRAPNQPARQRMRLLCIVPY